MPRMELRGSVGVERVLAAPNMKEQTRNTEDTDRAPRGVHKEEFSAFSADLRVLCGHVFGSLALKKLCRIEMNGSILRHWTNTGNITIHDGKSFRMRRYEKCASKSRRIRTYENIGLKVLWIPYLQKNRGGPSLDQSAKEFDSLGPLRNNRHSVGQASLPVLTTTTSGAHKR